MPENYDTISLKSLLLFHGLTFFAPVWKRISAGAVRYQGMGKMHPHRAWLQKVGPGSPLKGLADPLVAANFANAPLPSSRGFGLNLVYLK
jgi:hypothetical protein